MPVTVNSGSSNVVKIRVSRKLHKDDYEHFVPEIEKLMEKHGKIRIVFEMNDFHGWDAGALWEDVKFDLKHFDDIERLAMIGDKKWEQGMALFCRPFTKAKIQYFDESNKDAAAVWIKGA